MNEIDAIKIIDGDCYNEKQTLLEIIKLQAEVIKKLTTPTVIANRPYNPYIDSHVPLTDWAKSIVSTN